MTAQDKRLCATHLAIELRSCCTNKEEALEICHMLKDVIEWEYSRAEPQGSTP